jgi:hypothetical protein
MGGCEGHRVAASSMIAKREGYFETSGKSLIHASVRAACGPRELTNGPPNAAVLAGARRRALAPVGVVQSMA